MSSTDSSRGMRARWRRLRSAGPARFWLAMALLLGCTALPLASLAASNAEDLAIARDLATLLRSARTVISVKQALINDPAIGDKGITGVSVMREAARNFRKATGRTPDAAGPDARRGRLMRALIESITEVVDEASPSINKPGIGFKGFVPAVFARLVNERFASKVGDEASIKVTAPPRLVRNRMARPDSWERSIFADHLLSPVWPRGKEFATVTRKKGRDAYRVLMPEYYGKGCLACHGTPKGQIDVTGYPKEGGKLGDLAGAISIALFR